jgi:hypothetical protein
MTKVKDDFEASTKLAQKYKRFVSYNSSLKFRVCLLALANQDGEFA